jgi:hypothetical protein
MDATSEDKKLRVLQIATAMDRRWSELDAYRQELENLLGRALTVIKASHTKRDDLEILCDPCYEETFPGILHASVWVMTTAFMEKELRVFCHLAQSVLDLNLRFGDISGSWVERFQKYLLHVSGLPVPFTEEDWNDLLGVIEVRNCYSHNLGELDGFSRRQLVENFCSNNMGPRIERGKLVFDSSTSILVMGIGGRFLGEAYDTLYEHV